MVSALHHLRQNMICIVNTSCLSRHLRSFSFTFSQYKRGAIAQRNYYKTHLSVPPPPEKNPALHTVHMRTVHMKASPQMKRPLARTRSTSRRPKQEVADHSRTSTRRTAMHVCCVCNVQTGHIHVSRQIHTSRPGGLCSTRLSEEPTRVDLSFVTVCLCEFC